MWRCLSVVMCVFWAACGPSPELGADAAADSGLSDVSLDLEQSDAPADLGYSDVDVGEVGQLPDSGRGDTDVGLDGAVDARPTDASTNVDAAVDGGPAALCSLPSEDNTGPSSPALLVPSGSITTTENGQVIENVDVTGNIRILHNDVIVRNFRVSASGPYGIQAHTGAERSLIEHGEVRGAYSAGVIAANATIRFLNIHDIGGDGAKTNDNTTWECNWMHHLGTSEGAHADGIQNVGNGSNIVVRWNHFDMPINESPRGPGSPYKSNAALIFSTNNGPINNVLVEYNTMNGGNYTLYFLDKGRGYGPPTGIVVRNNRFGEDYRYGLFSNHVASDELEACGNTWLDGSPIVALNEDGEMCP